MSTRGVRPRAPGVQAEKDIEAMIRVDHAGEYGAVRIYEGQLAVFDALNRTSQAAESIRAMARAEQRHLQTFDRLVNERKVRPTALEPVWRVAGFALGAATGTRAAARSARATGCDGMRTATVSRPAVTVGGTHAARGSTSVNGPGQKRRARSRASACVLARSAVAFCQSTSGVTSSKDATWTISGSCDGRPFTANSRPTASTSSAWTPSP